MPPAMFEADLRLKHEKSTSDRSGVLLSLSMETAGVEPASENPSARLSPGADRLLCFPLTSPAIRVRESVAV